MIAAELLRSVEGVDPPAALGARIEARWLQQRRRRHLAAAGVMAALVLSLVPMLRPVAPVAPSPETIAALRTIDRQLQAAYATHGSAEDIATLWQARRSLLDASGTHSNDPIRPVRM